jgi:quercetin dioxygenase-like cupin family protein
MLLTLLLQPFLEVRAANPPEPVTRFLFRTAGLVPPSPFEIATIWTSAPVGGSTPVHHHPGLLLGTVLGGVVTFVDNTGKVTNYPEGQTFIEQPHIPGLARNDQTVPNFAMVTTILPKGVPYSAPEDGQPTPKVPVTFFFQNRVDGKPISGDYEVVVFVLDFGAGAQTPSQAYGGQTVVTAIDGDLSYVVNGKEASIKATKTLEVTAGEFGQVRNASSGNVRAFVAVLLPKGKTLVTTSVPGAPASGGGGTSPGKESWPNYLMFTLFGVTGVSSLLILNRLKRKKQI